MNQVIAPRIAIVNGERTYLAGCRNTVCRLDCLRKDARLITRDLHDRRNTGKCGYFIQAGQQT